MRIFEKSISFLEGSLQYLNSSDKGKIKYLILIKLSESYNKVGNKQKAMDI